MNITLPAEIQAACETAIDRAVISGKNVEKDPEIHPLVGAVVLDARGNEIASGARREDGKSHAEICAINNLEGGPGGTPHTFVTTLEPCSYRVNHDNEICCAKKVTRLGVRQCVVGTLDPAMGVRGRGVQILQGRQVYVAMFPKDLQAHVTRLNRNYLTLHWGLYTKGKRVLKKRGIVRDDQEFDLKFGPKRLRDFLISRKFGKLVRPIYKFHADAGLATSAEEFAGYFGMKAASEGSIVATRMEDQQADGRSLFDLAADYLAVPPGETDDEIRDGRETVYQYIGEWWYKRRRRWRWVGGK